MVSASPDCLIDITGGKINIHVLMALAAFASVFMGNPLEGGLLLAMFNLAHIAEEYFTSRSKIDVKELKENYPDFALVLDVNEKSPNFSDLSYKEVLFPVYCEVFQGRSTITIEHLTGEVKPVERKVGDSIPGGARNVDGMMIMKFLTQLAARFTQAKKTWKDSMLSRIVQLTEEAQLSKPKLQRWLDKFGEHYTCTSTVLVMTKSCSLQRISLLSSGSHGGSITMCVDCSSSGICYCKKDAPALAAATVGIVLAQRAIAVADAMLLQDNISGVPFCIAKSRQTTSLGNIDEITGVYISFQLLLDHALNDPTSSWKQNLLDLVDMLKSIIMLQWRNGTRPAPAPFRLHCFNQHNLLIASLK
ncbi:heavy metal atpase 1 [Actinidia rufa]|uniref:Heavy metal atpase 1 n=1 Tax=Actinidia rufa TaxID=165716 RepID=A0A7J0EJG0_9ERIC|nr:heavy metal atpase 1 [Actinidia rufa]